MVPASSSPQKRRIAPRLALVAFAAVVAVGLTQCKLAPDKVVGLEKANPSAPGQCISDCAHKANEANKAEKDLHDRNVRNCAGNSACLAAEDARHDAAKNAIQDGRKRCMDDCHKQGGGRGGR